MRRYYTLLQAHNPSAIVAGSLQEDLHKESHSCQSVLELISFELLTFLHFISTILSLFANYSSRGSFKLHLSWSCWRSMINQTLLSKDCSGKHYSFNTAWNWSSGDRTSIENIIYLLLDDPQRSFLPNDLCSAEDTIDRGRDIYRTVKLFLSLSSSKFLPSQRSMRKVYTQLFGSTFSHSDPSLVWFFFFSSFTFR